VELQGVEVTRPLTHDLLKSVIEQLGAEVENVVVNDLRDDVFYARLSVKVNGKTIEVDSRPSDAIALGVRFKVPIYVAQSVMAKAAIEPEEEITAESASGEESKPEREAPASEEDLGAFKDFLDTLDLDNLDTDG
jgi:bifunctional DNase/RNase